MPLKPVQVRRPALSGVPPSDCSSCHTFLALLLPSIHVLCILLLIRSYLPIPGHPYTAWIAASAVCFTGCCRHGCCLVTYDSSSCGSFVPLCSEGLQIMDTVTLSWWSLNDGDLQCGIYRYIDMDILIYVVCISISYHCTKMRVLCWVIILHRW